MGPWSRSLRADAETQACVDCLGPQAQNTAWVRISAMPRSPLARSTLGPGMRLSYTSEVMSAVV
ncbi:MAG: hypothetical protein BGO96_05125 [Micrococcales bacterium 73-15]|nr:MAG: hypothetical protein BGO96_05125 [Micrococcales bacterium 73-15]